MAHRVLEIFKGYLQAVWVKKHIKEVTTLRSMDIWVHESKSRECDSARCSCAADDQSGLLKRHKLLMTLGAYTYWRRITLRGCATLCSRRECSSEDWLIAVVCERVGTACYHIRRHADRPTRKSSFKRRIETYWEIELGMVLWFSSSKWLWYRIREDT